MKHSLSAIRRLPRYQIVVKLRKRHVRQRDIADVVGMDPSFVCRVLGREIVGTENAEAVWREVERQLAAPHAR